MFLLLYVYFFCSSLGGYQTRSRAILQHPRQGGEPCPAALFETRPCFSGPCLTFDWAVKDGNTVCQRSDGVQVTGEITCHISWWTFVKYVVLTGGCDGRPRPCVVPCTIEHAECSREGLCACASGFAPRYEPQSRGRRLRACVPMSSPAAAAAPGAQAAAEAAGYPLPPEDAEIQSRFYYPSEHANRASSFFSNGPYYSVLLLSIQIHLNIIIIFLLQVFSLWMYIFYFILVNYELLTIKNIVITVKKWKHFIKSPLQYGGREANWKLTLSLLLCYS